MNIYFFFLPFFFLDLVPLPVAVSAFVSLEAAAADASENKVQDGSESEIKLQGYLVEKKQRVEADADTADVQKSNESRLPVHHSVSKWNGVRIEYEDSSLMYKYTQDVEDEEDKARSQIESNLVQERADNMSKAATKPNESDQSEYVQKLVKQHQRKEKEQKEREQAALDWEIREIQKEIEDERKRWDGVWSDEEGDGAETEAIFNDQKRRNDVIQAVLDEVQKTNKKAEGEDSKLDKYTKKGEGWKRLQLIAESRVNTDPDQANKYPNHKFPLKD